MSVFGRGRDATFASLPALIERLAELEPSDGLDDDRLTALRAQAEDLRLELDELLARVTEIRRSTAGQPSPTTKTSKSTAPRLIRVAEELSSLHAKVAALGVWLFNRDHLDAFFADGEWLHAALERRQVHQYEVGDLEQTTARRLFTRMNTQRADHEFFSVRTVRMAAPGARETGRDDAASTTAA